MSQWPLSPIYIFYNFYAFYIAFMETPLWLFQRDEIDVLETELDALWDRHVRHGNVGSEEEAALKEYAETEDRAEMDVMLRAGVPSHEMCQHETEQRQAFEQMTVVEYLRRGAERDPLYVHAYGWANRVTHWAESSPVSDAFRAQVNALLVPVKIAFAQSGALHQGRAAREMTRSDYDLALIYLGRARESLQCAGSIILANEASALFEAVSAQRAAFERGSKLV